MTKEQQIEELTKLIQTKEMHPCGDDIPCADCYCACKGMAEMIYNAGYRKVPENERFVNNMKNVLEIEKKNAVKEFAERVKFETAVDNRLCVREYDIGYNDGYSEAYYNFHKTIDEILKEYEE
nr:MAG TPA: hypothetical protein [Caudoviricetes sp.]